jgi:hypothetical protein
MLDAEFWANYSPPDDDADEPETIDGTTLSADQLAAILS